ncbi:unnamed protein product [Caenorhabditis angaria]|uniref:Uncharacterized protein n=1 Tax=Caenorhabditis angaria TaxID=860376 RepID=A0A9P1IYI4_9PELO|nr:unnamed protein product [Caenorhabditis angaria]
MSRLLSAYGGSFYTSTAFLAVMFIHRYFSVAKPAQLFLFRGKRITLWITYSLIIGSSCYFSCTYLLAPDEYSLKYVAPEILKIYGIVFQISLPTGILLSLFEIYPAIDSLIVMYIITDYHKAIKGILS